MTQTKKTGLFTLAGLLLVSGAWAATTSDQTGAASTIKQGQFLGAKDSPHPSWFKESFLDLEEDVREAAAANKRLIIYFYQEGCPYCNQLVEHNFAQRDIVDKVRGQFELVALNMWGDREVVTVAGGSYTEKELATALKVQYTPTLLFFNEKGKVILRLAM